MGPANRDLVRVVIEALLLAMLTLQFAKLTKLGDEVSDMKAGYVRLEERVTRLMETSQSDQGERDAARDGLRDLESRIERLEEEKYWRRYDSLFE